MVIAALVSFAILVIAWMFAPSQPPMPVVAPTAVPSVATEAEALAA